MSFTNQHEAYLPISLGMQKPTLYMGIFILKLFILQFYLVASCSYSQDLFRSCIIALHILATGLTVLFKKLLIILFIQKNALYVQ